jgi:high-affinity Fe2+/Pb2+ permease
MKKKYEQVIRWLKGRIKTITPGKNAVRGASLGLLTVTAIFWLIYSMRVYIDLKDQWVLLFLFSFVLAATLFGFVIRWLIKLYSFRY